MARQTAPINQNRKKTNSAQKNHKTGSRKPIASASKSEGLKLNGSNDTVNEIIMIAAIALCFITLLSQFTQSTGAFGQAVREITFGFFGFCAYLIPFTIIFYCGYLLVKDKKINVFKLSISFALFVFISAFMYLLSNAEYESMKFVQYIMRHYSEGSWKNGGLFGAVVGDFFVGAFGKVGAYVLIAALFIICFILISGKSFFSIIGSILKSTKPAIQRVAVKTSREAPMQKKYRPQKRTPENVVDISDLYEDYEDEEQEPEETKYFDSYEKEPSEEIPETKIPKQEFNISFDEKISEPLFNDYKPQKENERINPHKPQLSHEAVNIEEYIFPPMDLLQKTVTTHSRESKEQTLKNAKKLEETLASFGVDAKVLQINRGPTVTRYELTPKQGVKVSKIVNLADDIALNLAAAGIRIEAPIPGKAAVGIEVPNKEAQSVFLREVVEDDAFTKFPSKLAFGVGKDIAGTSVVADIAKMPHLLIAGATGSGKSVCINTIITSILYKASPQEVKLLMVDPKVVELSIYNGIPHLLIPVVTDPKKAAGALHWAVQEMVNRYKLFAEYNVRDMKGYNQVIAEKDEGEPFPQIVIIIDELADLMMAAPREVEDSICRLAQMARAAGLHLIIATQRPSVDVITGVIKANIPSRLAFAVSSGVDSRTILDVTGAEKLLGKGDMLFYPSGIPKPVRIQGAFVSDKEVESIVNFIKQHHYTEVDQSKINEITSPGKNPVADENSDEFFEEAVTLLVEKEKASTSMLQRQFRIGYNRASRLMEELEVRGIVGPEDGSKPRKVLLTKKELTELRQEK